MPVFSYLIKDNAGSRREGEILTQHQRRKWFCHLRLAKSAF